MSEKSKPKLCTRGCGTIVYFDKNSPTGYPSTDRWIPLKIKEGRRTDVAHNCPKRSGSGNSGTLYSTTTTTGTISTPDFKICRSTLSNTAGIYQDTKGG